MKEQPVRICRHTHEERDPVSIPNPEQQLDDAIVQAISKVRESTNS
jgi:hypothetical protein